MTLLTRFARSSLKIATNRSFVVIIGVWWSIPGGLYPAHVALASCMLGMSHISGRSQFEWLQLLNALATKLFGH